MTETSKQFEILLGLLVNQSASDAAVPDEEQLAAWFEHKLEGDDKRAVEAWLAQSDEGIAALSALMEAEESGILQSATTQSAPTRTGIVDAIKNWWLAGGTLVFACVLGVAVVLPILQTPELSTRIDDGYGDLLVLSGGQYAENWPYTVAKSFDPFADKPRNNDLSIAFTSGVVEGIKQSGASSAFWQRVVTVLSKERVDCQKAEDSQACAKQTDLLRNLGRWTLMNRLACEQPATVKGDFWGKQAGSATEFINLLQEFETTVAYIGHVRAFKMAQSQRARCEAINALMAYGLGQ